MSFGKKKTLAFAVMAMFVWASSAQAILIDTFEDAHSVNFSGPPGTMSGNELSPAPGALGGHRDIHSSITANPSNNFIDNSIHNGGNSRWSISQGDELEGISMVTWDGDDNDANGVATAGLGSVDLSPLGEDRFELGIDFMDVPGDISIQVWSNGGADTDTVTHNLAGGVFAPTTETFLFSEFTGVDFGDVSALKLTVDGTVIPSLDMNIDFIRSAQPTPTPGVPEPATFGLLGLAGLAMLRRRRAA